ncbi:hypothetical protein C0J52_17911 [Blattella germanica]|nr:hypothetical protein C0J52_17911 [Blattella germanica]
MECVAKKLNLLDSKGFLKADKITEFISRLAEGDSKLEGMLKSLNRGTLSTVNNMAATNKAENAFAKCNFVLQLYMQFVFNMLLLNCPQEMQHGGIECYKLWKVVDHNFHM